MNIDKAKVKEILILIRPDVASGKNAARLAKAGAPAEGTTLFTHALTQIGQCFFDRKEQYPVTLLESGQGRYSSKNVRNDPRLRCNPEPEEVAKKALDIMDEMLKICDEGA